MGTIEEYIPNIRPLMRYLSENVLAEPACSNR